MASFAKKKVVTPFRRSVVEPLREVGVGAAVADEGGLEQLEGSRRIEAAGAVEHVVGEDFGHARAYEELLQSWSSERHDDRCVVNSRWSGELKGGHYLAERRDVESG